MSENHVHVCSRKDYLDAAQDLIPMKVVTFVKLAQGRLDMLKWSQVLGQTSFAGCWILDRSLLCPLRCELINKWTNL